LRAFDRPVPSDSEMSSSSDDPDESDAERDLRRNTRRAKRLATMQKVQKLRREALPNYKDVDSVMQWMDGHGRPGQVGTSSLLS